MIDFGDVCSSCIYYSDSEGCEFACFNGYGQCLNFTTIDDIRKFNEECQENS